MKKLCSIVLVVLALSSCVGTPNNTDQKFANVQQDNFEIILAKNRESYYRLGNDILRKEFSDSVKVAMGEYMDSVKLFVNWVARIHHVDITELRQSILLSFDLEYGPREYIPNAFRNVPANNSEVTFRVDYGVSKDSADSDQIYQKLKTIDEYSTVYFDGFIRMKSNGEAHYVDSDYDTFIHRTPKFKFFIVDINKVSKGDTLSRNLANAVGVSYEIMKQVERSTILKKELDRHWIDSVATKNKSAKEILTSEELEYLNRFTHALSRNFLYAE